MAYCENCGNKLTENAKFCANCGKSMVENEQAHASTNTAFTKHSFEKQTYEKQFTSAPKYSAPKYSAPQYSSADNKTAKNTNENKPELETQTLKETKRDESFAYKPPATSEVSDAEVASLSSERAAKKAQSASVSRKPPTNKTYETTSTQYNTKAQYNTGAKPTKKTYETANAQYSVNAKHSEKPSQSTYNIKSDTKASYGTYNNVQSDNKKVNSTYDYSAKMQNEDKIASRKKAQKLVFMLAGAVVVFMFIFVFLMVILPAIINGATNSDRIEAEHVGTWHAAQITMDGLVMSVDEFYPDGMQLELEEGGECYIFVYDEYRDGTWQTSGEEFTLDYIYGYYNGRIDDYSIEIYDFLGEGFDVTFTKEGAVLPEPEVEAPVDDFDSQASETFVAPGYGAENTIAVDEIINPSEWYGTLTVSDYIGMDSWLEGTYEAWGRINTDINDIPYFEIYVYAPSGSESSATFCSYYIEFVDDTFYPIVDDTAWMLDAPLRTEDNDFYAPTLVNGVLSATYEYDYNGETFTMVYELAQIATD